LRKLPPLARTLQRPPKKLEASIELHELTKRLLQCAGAEDVASEMLGALMAYHHADFGDVQILGENGADLEVVAQRGFDPAKLSKIKEFARNAQSPHSLALKHKGSVLSEDTRSEPVHLAPYSGTLAEAGVLAVQTTPLVRADGTVAGVISTYFRKPHRFSASIMQVTALYAQQGAHLLNRAPTVSPERAAIDDRRQHDEAGEHHSLQAGEYAPLYRKIAQFGQLDAEEIPVLRDMIRETRNFEADTEFGREGESSDDCLIVLEGWGCKYKDLEDGTRQIIHFPILGDFVGVHARLFKAADHSFATITACKLGVFSAERLQEVIQSYPRLGQAILWSAARDKAIMVEHLVNIGRRNAHQRIAHFLLEICSRMDFAGLGKDGHYRCPLTQDHLADALGLTSIHVNRVLRQLRERELVSLERGTLHIKDFYRLSELAAFDPDYLDQSA
jgi:CRP-like cAMP-binding protein